MCVYKNYSSAECSLPSLRWPTYFSFTIFWVLGSLSAALPVLSVFPGGRVAISILEVKDRGPGGPVRLNSDYCFQAWDGVITVPSALSPSVVSLKSVSVMAPVSKVHFYLCLFLSSFLEVESSGVGMQLPGVVRCNPQSQPPTAALKDCFSTFSSPRLFPVAASSSFLWQTSPSFLRSLVLPWPEMLRARGLLETSLPCLGRLAAA